MLEVSIFDHGFNESVISLAECITSTPHTTLLWRVYRSKQAEDNKQKTAGACKDILSWGGKV